MLLFKYTSLLFPHWTAQKALDIFGTPQKIPRPPSEENFYSSAKKYFLKSGFAAYEWGSENKELILLIHGWNGRGTQMGAFAEPLIKNNFRVIALDGPAHGASPGKVTNPSEYADFILKAAQELGSVYAVIAHSLGAGCSALALQRGLKIQKLIYIAGPSLYERIANAYCEILHLKGRSKEIFFELLTKRVGMPPRDLHIAKFSTSIPALIVHDEDDKQIPFSEALEIAKAWPQAEIFKTQGLGHRRVLKDSAVLKKSLEFLSAQK